MKLMEEVYPGQFMIASRGFNSSEEAFADIAKNHEGYESVLYYASEEKKWYILHRVDRKNGI